jgi:hypothetical protein
MGMSWRSVDSDTLGPLTLFETENIKPVPVHDLDSRGGEPGLVDLILGRTNDAALGIVYDGP